MDDRRTDATRTGHAPAASDDVERSAAAWLARRDGGRWGADDDDALEAWLAAAVEHRVAFLRLESAWEEFGRLKALGAGLRDGPPPRGHWSATFADMAPRAGQRATVVDSSESGGGMDLRDLVFARRAPVPRRPLRGFAALAAGAAVAALAWGWQGLPVTEASSHRTALGDTQVVTLADGSRTTLASDSRIDVSLSRRRRVVDLQRGEAFFDAARDPRRPFVVEAGERRVVAVGTRFSVRRDGPDLRVVVTEGTVRLESQARDGAARPAAVLPAGSVALATADGVLVQSGSVADAERLLGWREGLLVFRDATLAEAAAEFNRYNARKLVVADAEVAALRIGGSFRWANAEAFARLLEQGFPVHAEYRDDRIVLRNP